MKACAICRKIPGQQHHIIKRSQARHMIKASINHIYLCEEHHKGTYGVHGKEGHKLDMRLKLQLQKQLFILFSKESYTERDIQQMLGISNKDVRMLVKLISCNDDRYERVDIVRVAMGGMLYAK